MNRLKIARNILTTVMFRIGSGNMFISPDRGPDATEFMEDEEEEEREGEEEEEEEEDPLPKLPSPPLKPFKLEASP